MKTPSKKLSPISTMTVAIVEPTFGSNIGYVARTMANFGLGKLVVVSKEKMSSETQAEAAVFSSHGKEIIDGLNYVRDLNSLRGRFSVLIGTTAIEASRKSNLTRRTLDLRECAITLRKRLVGLADGDVCLVLGRDTTGLTNEELRLCDYSLTIKTGSAYNTLNISHAAAIILYEFSQEFRQRNSSVSTRKPRSRNIAESKPRDSTRKERDRTVKLFEELAAIAEFQEFKRGLLKEALTRVLNRGDPSLREVYLLMGIASKASAKIRRLSSK